MKAAPAETTKLRVLIVEDSEIDAALMVRELQHADFVVEHTRVATGPDLQAALAAPAWDVVLSDSKMPGFGGMEALAIVKATVPDLPFLLISGTLGEEAAVAAIRAGAADFFIKGRLSRLGATVARELRERVERQARRATEDQVRQLSHAVRQAPVSIMITDVAGNIEYVNPKFTELTGYTLEEVRGRNPRLLKTGLTPPAVYAELWQTITAGREWQGELCNRRKDGQLFWESASLSAIRDASGRITHFLAAKLDITERKHAESRLREQAKLLNDVTDAITVCTLEGVITFWNEGAERLYGWSQAEALGRPMTALQLDQLTATAASLTRSGTDRSWSGEQRQTTKDGREIIVFVRLTLVADEQGRPASILAINTDITEAKRLEARFLQAQRLESLGALASGIAHDLNNVLAPVLLATSVLKNSMTSEAQRQMLTTMEASVRRGSSIIRQILVFARGTQGERAAVQPRSILDETAEIIRETFPKNIAVETRVAEVLWTVVGDATQLHQILMNLSVNARDAMPAGGRLTLAGDNVELDETFVQMTPGAKAGPHVCLRVSDTGTGIAPEHGGRIFDPFFTTKAPGFGTGLGLSTALGIVKSHGGFMQFRSAPATGTCFAIYLPASREIPAAADPMAAPVPPGHGELILIVDDEISFRTVATKMLEGHGYRTVAASEGSEALAVFMQHRAEVAAVVTDMIMPNVDGLALVRLLRHIDPSIPIVGISGSGDASYLQTVESLALPVFLPKPFTAAKLLTALRQVLEKRSAARAPVRSSPAAGAPSRRNSGVSGGMGGTATFAGSRRWSGVSRAVFLR